MGFSRQEYWSGAPWPSPGDLPNPGIESWSSALQADALPSKPPGKLAHMCVCVCVCVCVCIHTAATLKNQIIYQKLTLLCVPFYFPFTQSFD